MMHFHPFFSFRALGAALLLAGACLAAPDARAQYATGGTGLHRQRIFWVDWGTNGQNVYAGETIVRGFNIGSPATPANRVDISCTLSNAQTISGTAGLFVYASGNWQGDGLDELYNIGGNHPGTGANPNTLSVGLRTSNASQVEFTFSCSATLGGNPIALGGLVFADAEASGGTEYVGARLTGGGTLRIIDQISQCGTSTNVTLAAGPEVRFNGPLGPQVSCEGNATPSLRAGPVLVGYIDGATTARVVVRGGGVSAVAVGAVLETEFSEALPGGFGAAAHLLSPVWSGGVATAGVNYNNPANLATLSYVRYLGTSLLPDSDASGPVGGSDVDALPKTTGPLGAGYANVPPPMPGPYTISGIVCQGTGLVSGWIDFNGNGAFDTGEQSNVVNCPAGSNTIALSWTVPAAGSGFVAQTTSYLRLRIVGTPAEMQPSGIAIGGETEDYYLRFPGADLRLTKTNTPGVNGEVDQAGDTVAGGSTTSYSLVLTNLGPDAADEAVLADPAPAGLTCTTATCTATGGASCPAQTGAALVAALQGAGATIPTLPLNGAVTITLTCTVN